MQNDGELSTPQFDISRASTDLARQRARCFEIEGAAGCDRRDGQDQATDPIAALSRVIVMPSTQFGDSSSKTLVAFARSNPASHGASPSTIRSIRSLFGVGISTFA